MLLWRTGPLRAAACAHLLFDAAAGRRPDGAHRRAGERLPLHVPAGHRERRHPAPPLGRGAGPGAGAGRLRRGALAGRGRSAPAPAATLWVHAAAFAATALLAGWLTEQLRTTGERLAASESDLADVTALHEAIVQSVTSGLLTIDGAGRITFLNRAGEQLTGLSAGTVRGASRWRASSRASSTTARRGETEWSAPDGQRRIFGFTSFPLAGARGGGARGQAVIFQDLTELRAMEETVPPQRAAGRPRAGGGRPGPRAAQPAGLDVRLRRAAAGGARAAAGGRSGCSTSSSRRRPGSTTW